MFRSSELYGASQLKVSDSVPVTTISKFVGGPMLTVKQYHSLNDRYKHYTMSY